MFMNCSSKGIYRNNNEKFRFFKSKENIYKKEVGPGLCYAFLSAATCCIFLKF